MPAQRFGSDQHRIWFVLATVRVLWLAELPWLALQTPQNRSEICWRARVRLVRFQEPPAFCFFLRFSQVHRDLGSCLQTQQPACQ